MSSLIGSRELQLNWHLYAAEPLPSRHSMIEPQTPPGRRVAQVYTPQTPRYGPLEDRPVPKKLFEEAAAAAANQPPTGHNHLLTPQKTPRRRLLNAPKTPSRGSGRQAPRHSAAMRKLAKIDEGVYLSTRHPHEPKPRNAGEGMMYVFRGKKVWRPFKAYEKPLEPVRLFDDLEPVSLFGGAADGVDGESEAETEVEVESDLD